MPIKPFVDMYIDQLVKHIDREQVYYEFRIRLSDAGMENWKDLLSFYETEGDPLMKLEFNTEMKQQVVEYWKKQNEHLEDEMYLY